MIILPTHREWSPRAAQIIARSWTSSSAAFDVERIAQTAAGRRRFVGDIAVPATRRT
jgi:hypothetical protein